MCIKCDEMCKQNSSVTIITNNSYDISDSV